MKANERAKGLSKVSQMADNAFMGGVITAEEHEEVKGKVREAQLDNLFKAMADYCV